ncbi:MAG: lanthionine synthetase LanC family protein [Egibacteraceae bacterium]
MRAQAYAPVSAHPLCRKLVEWTTHSVQQPGPQRPSWCYGTPGLTRAQQLAALALGDRQRQRQAENALAGCITDDK